MVMYFAEDMIPSVLLTSSFLTCFKVSHNKLLSLFLSLQFHMLSTISISFSPDCLLFNSILCTSQWRLFCEKKLLGIGLQQESEVDICGSRVG